MASDMRTGAQNDAEGLPDPVNSVALWDMKAANWLSLVGLGCLVTGIVIVILMYAYAWQQVLYPNPAALPATYRGAWSSNQEWKEVARLLLNIPVCGFFSGLLSLVFKPTQRGKIVVVGCLIFAVFALFWSISMLED